MAQTFQDILNQVTAQSDPQRQIVLGQIADLPNQQAAQTSAIGAQKDQAYDQITNEAQERGLGFSGIPLGEQAKYDSTTYAPALANLATSFNGQKATLESSLAGLGSNDYSTANDIFNQQQSLAEQQREFDANLAEQQKEAAASVWPPTPTPTPTTPPSQATLTGGHTNQDAYNFVQDMLKGASANSLRTMLTALQASARNGNTYDQAKLKAVNSIAGASHPLLQQVLANFNGASF